MARLIVLTDPAVTARVPATTAQRVLEKNVPTAMAFPVMDSHVRNAVNVPLLDAVIVFTVLEGLGLWLHHRITGEGLAPGDYALNMLSGLCLMLAVRADYRREIAALPQDGEPLQPEEQPICVAQ